ncbi:MAG: translation initiation factor IF-2 [Anaerovoracaceae bacterium]|nr:translation initiation factor IF-2 [Anaerovoracaceae bacterium]
MTVIKINELAKELRLTADEMSEKLKSMGIDDSSGELSIDDVVRIRNEAKKQETKVVKTAPKKHETKVENEPKVQVKAAKVQPSVKTKKTPSPAEKKAPAEKPGKRPPLGKPMPKDSVPVRTKPIPGTPVAKQEVNERNRKAVDAIKATAKPMPKKVEEPAVKNEPVKAEEPVKEVPKAEEPVKEVPKKEIPKSEPERNKAPKKEEKKSDPKKESKSAAPKKGEKRVKAEPVNEAPVKSSKKKKEEKHQKSREQHDKFSKMEKGNQKRNDERGYGSKSLEKKERKKHVKNKKEDNTAEQIVIPEGSTAISVPITVAGFCEQLEISTATVIMALMKLGIMANINQNLDETTVEILAAELGLDITVASVEEEEAEEGIEDFEDKEEDLKPRPPIITVMGHVDHGKTSLLDAIRSTNVTASESGGITQHIGASEVMINGQKIVFLDTPGHEAFTAMRARGAHVTDIAVLVVAADDGVMPQTVESISHAKAAGVPIIVAINKMDKPAANPDRVKQELTEHGILVEDWGGDVISVPVSAKTGEGITNLLEMILLQAEMLELKANPARLASGTVIEARLDKARGPVATLLVLNGTLKSGQSVVAGTCSGRIRLMTNYKGSKIAKAAPATAVEILGLTDVPQAGDEFNAVREDKVAREIAEKRKQKQKEEIFARNSASTLEDLFSQIQEGETKDLNLIVKADVQGSVGAIVASLEKLKNENVRVKIIHTGVGTVNESDIMLAGTSDAIIIGFNVRPSTAVTEMAERDGVQIRTYRVIYDIINDVEDAMKGMLDPEFREVVLGKIEVRETFKVPGVGIIAGAYVQEGKAQRNAEIRLVRDGIVIHEGRISSLKRFKDDAKEVQHGFECGIGIENFNDIKIGDIIECFIMEEVER